MSGGQSVPGAYTQLRDLLARQQARTTLPASTGPERVHPDPPRQAGVLVLFGVLDHVPSRAPSSVVPRELDVLLVRRADDLRHHPGQVSFPGGRADPGDADIVATALREAQEETGVDPAGVDVLGTLPGIEVPVSNHVVTPVLAWWDRPSPVRVVDHRESSAVFRAPVADLLHPRSRRTATLQFQGALRRTPAFVVAGHLVWGFTALVLDRLFEDLGWAVPWDTGRTVEISRGDERDDGRP